MEQVIIKNNTTIEDLKKILDQGYDGISLKHLINYFIQYQEIYNINEILESKEKRKKTIVKNNDISQKDKILLYGLLGDIKSKRKKDYEDYEKMEDNERNNIIQKEHLEYTKKILNYYEIIFCIQQENIQRKKMEQLYLLEQKIIEQKEKLQKNEMECRQKLKYTEEINNFLLFVQKEKEENFLCYEKRHATKIDLFESFLFTWKQTIIYFKNIKCNNNNNNDEIIINNLQNHNEKKEQYFSQNENEYVSNVKRNNKNKKKY